MENDPSIESDLHDLQPAVSCTQADAVAGNAEAQFGMAFSLAAGSARQDYTKAAEWYVKAADQNHRLAQFNLGQMFANGQGVPQNDSTAVMWIRRAANGGDAGAQYNLGDRYGRSSVRGSEMDVGESRVESYKWFKLAAAQGYRDALDRSDSATQRMSREEVTEGNRRVSTFATA
jgi:TPR repeat protein